VAAVELTLPNERRRLVLEREAERSFDAGDCPSLGLAPRSALTACAFFALQTGCQVIRQKIFF
jgi:hypothetical protein